VSEQLLASANRRDWIIGYGKNDYVLMVGGARDGSRLARVLYPRLSEHELIDALKHLVKAIRDRNPHRLPAGDYLNQTPDAELRRASTQSSGL